MTIVQVFDPALCCSSGVCGVDVDQALVNFSADVERLKQNRVKVERFNLAQQPQAFANNTLVKTFLEKFGQEGLPLIMVDGQQVQAGHYPSFEELAKWIKLTSAASETCCEPAKKVEKIAKSGCC
ncbi:MAG: arsenite efflux transporter metallochaperone ArsD [Oligoflexales bacterium]|nr:arsenite efflux transporter metallochaperone ArsD [Oligoflexales bacterium]